MPRATVEERLERIEKTRATNTVAGPSDEMLARTQAFAQQRAETLKLAEEILLARSEILSAATSTFAPRQFFTQDELAVVDALAWNDGKLRSEIGRVITVARWQFEAGTTRDRETAAQRLADCQAALADRGAEVEREIERLQRELRGLQRDETDARVEVDRRAEAVQQLRTLIPVAIREEHSRRLGDISPLRAELSEVAARLNGVREITALNVRSDSDARKRAGELCQSWGLEHRRDPSEGFVDVRGWERFATELAKELPTLEKRQTDLESQIEAETADADKLLDHYAR